MTLILRKQMKVYKVSAGQNIYDVALAIYGSLDGLFTLMADNPKLSFETELKAGDELYYDEESMIDDGTVKGLQEQHITPANAQRHVHMKKPGMMPACMIRLPGEETGMELWMEGEGTMVVDWGDNSQLEEIQLVSTISDGTTHRYHHYFDNVTEERWVRLYGDFLLTAWNLGSIKGDLYLTRPLTVDEVTVKENKTELNALFLFRGTYKVSITGVRLSGLQPIYDMSLSDLTLKDNNYTFKTVLDDYLIYIATHHNQRRACKVVTDTMPTGTYREPQKDSNGNYVITSGMEAVYVITHEETWNAAGEWTFDFNGTIYKYTGQ